jgi:RNA polymerase sigma factor (sigma-70 family)
MLTETATDDELLAARDTPSFELLYRRHFERMLAFFARRTRDPELAADLTAETFAAALASRSRFRPGRGRADSWLFAIAYHKLADAGRRGRAEERARRRLGMEPIALTDDDLARIEALADEAGSLVGQLAPDQRDAIVAHIIDERDYDEIAAAMNTSAAVVRQRVSRGLAAMRSRIGTTR